MPEVVRVGPAPISPLAVPHQVRMRDGVRLATDVYLPDGDASPGDTVLIRLPYDKCGEYTQIPEVAEYFMRHGYRVVAQDVRGKFRSEGRTVLFVHEVADGYDSIEWITHQPWSNGRVAMWGDSYYGYTQWAAASSRHPALRAISPRVTGSMLGEPVHARAGDTLRRVEWFISLMYPLTFFHSNDTFMWEPDWTRRPWKDQVEEFFEQVGERSPSYDLWYPHTVDLERYPNGGPFDGMSVPVLQTIGWWDNCAPLSWQDWRRIQASPVWAAHHHLRVESMDHECYYLDDPDELRVPERGPEHAEMLNARMLDPTVEFFEVYVRGNGSPTDLPKVAWNLAGTSGMQVSPTWPPPGHAPVRLHARPGGGLGTGPGTDATTVTWVHDPDDPVPSPVDNAFAFLLDRPDESDLSTRPDVLVHTTEPLAHDVDLAGPVTAHLTVTGTGPGADVLVRLYDVAPDGSALRVARGGVHVVDPSAPTAVDIDLDHVGYRLQAGHRLRVHVCSSDFPEYIPQTGTGEDPWTAVDGVPTTQTTVVGGPDGLALTLPLLRGELPR